MIYTAINIGPIISTFSMARKPRELWSASYMFSHLMRCIYNQVKTKKYIIISPENPPKENNKVGIYPDRIYFIGDLKGSSLLEDARDSFCGEEEKLISKKSFTQYFNVMSTTCDADTDSEAIKKLNQQLDVLELCNYGADYNKSHAIYNLIKKKRNSPLFEIETGNGNVFPFEINTLAEIATAQLRAIDEPKWKELRDLSKEREKAADKARKKTAENDDSDINPDLDEDDFYKLLQTSEKFKNRIKSHHKYFCVVQADGDNVGKTVSHQDLDNGQVKIISTALVHFGLKAAEIIEGFGGLPIYAGGDDLLFIAPVIGKDNTNILDLLNKIETEAFGGVAKIVENFKLHKYDDDGKETKELIEASLSFGISISYYKYPLYEALKSAHDLLFNTAKKIDDKKAIAWSFRMHSGGTFNAAFSLKKSSLQTAFHSLIESPREEIESPREDPIVSAVAHKIRQEEFLVKQVMESEKKIPYDAQEGKVPERPRLDALFDQVLEFQDNDYFKAVKEIMPILYNEVGQEKFISTLYSLLRTAKFIKGEDLHDEE